MFTLIPGASWSWSYG